MNTFKAVPDGVFPLKEVLAAPSSKPILKHLGNDPRPHQRKLKDFLTFYQTFDIVAQLRNQGFEPSSVALEEIATAVGFLIEKDFDWVIKNFEEDDRALLNGLFR